MITLIPIRHETLAPLDSDPANHRIANRPWAEALLERLETLPGEISWRIDFWPCAELLQALADAQGAWVVRDKNGDDLAFRGMVAEPQVFAPDGIILRHPWDVLAINEDRVAALTGDHILGEVDAAAHIRGRLHLGPGSRILPGVFMEGNVVVGANTCIGPNCYIRGNTVIGDDCHIGQAVEIKNCVIGDRVNAGHLSYLGDTVAGDDSNFGAGTITSNFRHDGAIHRCAINGVLIETGRRKFGAIIGKNVHTGIHTAIYPGRKLWPNTSTLPGEVVRKDKR